MYLDFNQYKIHIFSFWSLSLSFFLFSNSNSDVINPIVPKCASNLWHEHE